MNMNTETFRDMLNKNDQTWNNVMKQVAGQIDNDDVRNDLLNWLSR